MGALGFKIWIFAPKSCLFGGIRVQNQLISTDFSCFIYIFLRYNSCFFHQYFVKIMLQSLTYVSSLFTFSAVCLLFRQLIVYFCQLFVYTLNFRAQILGFPPVFCQNNASKLDICQQQFVYIFSNLFTISAVYLLFCQLIVYFL